jgi:hypothetical protein
MQLADVMGGDHGCLVVIGGAKPAAAPDYTVCSGWRYHPPALASRLNDPARVALSSEVLTMDDSP